MNQIKIIEALKKNGFTEYESKVYISLLESHPLNGNMIALSSGVPGPKVYETLRRMEDKGFVYSVSEANKPNSKRYSPIPFKDLLKMFEDAFQDNYKLLEKGFELLGKTGNLEWAELFHINGYEPSLQAVREEIDNAKNQILLSGWSKEVNELHENLTRANDLGVEIVTIIFDQYSKEIPWKNVKHFTFNSSNQKHEGELNIVVDTKRAIILESSHESAYAVVSSHQSLVKSTMNYIRHDIYLNRVIDDFTDLLKEKYGKNIEELIDW